MYILRLIYIYIKTYTYIKILCAFESFYVHITEKELKENEQKCQTSLHDYVHITKKTKETLSKPPKQTNKKKSKKTTPNPTKQANQNKTNTNQNKKPQIMNN